VSREWFAAVAALALLSCQRETSTPAATPVAAATESPDDAQPSASLAGVAADADVDTPDNAFVLPGALGPDTDVAALRRLFGGSNVRVGEVPGPEGTTAQGVTLFADDPSRRAYLYFQNETEGAGLALVNIKDRPSRWALDSGVRPGMSLSELLALNGKPVKLMGFDWDYGGYISDWHGGRLARKQGDMVRRGVRLDTREANNGHPTGSYPSGDGEFNSDDPRYPRLGEIAEVGEISVSFPGEDDL